MSRSRRDILDTKAMLERLAQLLIKHAPSRLVRLRGVNVPQRHNLGGDGPARHVGLMTRFIIRTTLEFIILAAFVCTLLAWVAYLEGIIR